MQLRQNVFPRRTIDLFDTMDRMTSQIRRELESQEQKMKQIFDMFENPKKKE